ncbi:hypothetical protein BU16DRAFT_607214 [Lophium mytilinum]|uniref:Uncharacterized protein n=1 Tax=Lophium mytilinum TaxID=390894 RepID=A0A6A6QVQ6_9PEZI|nr:hypothetical protein BU16DRAFT_607214 [Lophium mytilinum]
MLKRKLNGNENETSTEPQRKKILLSAPQQMNGSNQNSFRALQDLPVNSSGGPRVNTHEGPHGAPQRSISPDTRYSNASEYLLSSFASTVPTTATVEGGWTGSHQQTIQDEAQLLGARQHQPYVVENEPEETVATIPTSTPAGYPGFQGHFKDFGLGLDWRADSRRQQPYLKPETDVTINQARGQMEAWVRLIYNHITDLSAVRDTVTSEGYKRMVIMQQYSTKDIEGASIEILFEALEVCETGCRLHESLIGDVKKFKDNELTCFMRLLKICYALKHEKTLCDEVLIAVCGDINVKRLVNAPIARRRDKEKFRLQNWRRGEKGRQRNAGKTEVVLPNPSVIPHSPPKAEPPLNDVALAAAALGIYIPLAYRNLLVLGVEVPDAYRPRVEIDASAGHPDASLATPEVATPGGDADTEIPSPQMNTSHIVPSFGAQPVLGPANAPPSAAGVTPSMHPKKGKARRPTTQPKQPRKRAEQTMLPPMSPSPIASSSSHILGVRQPVARSVQTVFNEVPTTSGTTTPEMILPRMGQFAEELDSDFTLSPSTRPMLDNLTPVSDGTTGYNALPELLPQTEQASFDPSSIYGTQFTPLQIWDNAGLSGNAQF